MISVDKPSQISSSLANLIWPKSVEKIYKKSNMLDLTRNYLFNAFSPPKMTNISDMPIVGVFATRSSHRPNPICVSVVELVSRDLFISSRI